MSAPSVIKVGIIGAGKFSHRHVQAFTNTGKFKLVAASRRDPLPLKEFCDLYHVRGYPDFHQLIQDEEVDAILIATPHHLHAAISIEAARAKKHIMVEKPMALTVSDCEKINREVANSRIQLMIGHTTRFTSAFIKAQEMVQQGKVGRILQMSARTNTFWMGPDRKSWHLKKASGGGLLWTLGIHQLDLLMCIANSPVKSVRAALGHDFHNLEVDDHGIVWLNFENGIIATLFMTGFTKGVTSVDLEIFGQLGQLRISNRKGAFYAQDDAWHIIPGSEDINWMEDALVKQWQEFYESIHEERVPLVNGKNTQKVIEVIEAVFESSASQREIGLLN